MEKRVCESLLLRPGFEGREELLRDMVQDSVRDIRNFLNYTEEEEIPEGCLGAVKELTLIRFNRDGTEGIQSSGGSTSYSDVIPARIKKTVYRFRRLPR